MRDIPFGRPIIGEEEKQAVAEVLNGPMLVHGPRAKQFEEDFAAFSRAPHALSVSSCTAGLHLAYFYKGIGFGDEVIVPAQTHTATAHAVEFVGAKPVFVDAEPQTGNIDLDQVEQKITEKTKAISIVHYLGMPVNMDKLNAIAKKHNLFVVEDCALAIGTYYKGAHAGLHGDIGSFSFYPVKHMTTAEGGMVITKHKDIAEKINRQKAFGVDKFVGERKIPGVYDVTMLGYNYRMNEIEAALGVEQLKRMPHFLQKRKDNYACLQKAFADMDEVKIFQSSGGDFQSSYYCFSVILSDELKDKREEIQKRLKEKGVGTSVYYPQAVPCFTYYREKYGYKEADFPVASHISWNSVALSVGPHLEIEDMNYMINEFKNVLQEVK